MTSAANNPMLAFLLGALLALSGCADSEPAVRIGGGVFGTTWSLTYQSGELAQTPEQVESAVVAAFNVVNRQMNHYDPDSEISRFNGLPAGEPIEVGWDFSYVLGEALRIADLSDGAYDVTVSPLARLWGFGPDGPTQLPAEADIQNALTQTGKDKLIWEPTTRRLAKQLDGVSLDLSSIAKGYGVDVGADALDEMGVENYMLEVGGEVRLRGVSPRGDAWRIAIERPDRGPGVQAAVVGTDTGIATSGDYRNYFELDGQRFSHLLDPRTGRPIRHDLVSVTVVHPSTAIADAWATALIVIGYDEAHALAADLDLAVYFVRRRQDELHVEWTPAMEAYLVSTDP